MSTKHEAEVLAYKKEIKALKKQVKELNEIIKNQIDTCERFALRTAEVNDKWIHMSVETFVRMKAHQDPQANKLQNTLDHQNEVAEAIHG